MTLDLSSFKKAIATLEEAVNAYKNNQGNTFIRDACIQRFEYTYELAHKMMRRHLEITEPTATVIDDLSFTALIRLAYERGLLQSELAEWKKFRHARNLTSHTYDEEKANDVLRSFAKILD